MARGWAAGQRAQSASCSHGFEASLANFRKSAVTGSRPVRSARRPFRADQASPLQETRAAPLTWSYDAGTTQTFEQPSWQTARPASRDVDQAPFQHKPLKINRDLLLFKAKTLAAAAIHMPTQADRLEKQDLAEAALRRCLAMDATDGRSYVSLGKILVGQRRFDEARKLYEDGSMATDGGNAHIWQAWATLETRCGNVSYARQLFDAAVTAQGHHAASWHGWGLLEKRQGNLLRARDIWLKGIRKTVQCPNAFLYQSVAVLAGEMGLTTEARKWFQEATQLFRGAGRHGIWQAWAQMEARQGDRNVVRYLLRKGLEAAPRSRYLHLTWALWEKELGQRANARLLLQRGHEFNRSDPALLQAWAIMEEEDGHIDAARELLQKASLADPHHVPVWQAWGCLEHRQGNLNVARELFQSGVWAEPGSAAVTTVWQAWAVLEAQAGNYSLTRQLFKCAVKADPTSAPSWLGWAAFELEQGNLERAQELQDLHRQGNLQIVWPRGFAAGFAPPSERPGSALDPILASVSNWFAQFGVSGASQLPVPPSDAGKAAGGSQGPSMSSIDVDGGLELAAAMAKMGRSNSPNLQLPDAASVDFELEWDMDSEPASAQRYR